MIGRERWQRPMTEAELRAHSKATSKWRNSNIKTKSIGFDTRKVEDMALYNHIIHHDNATAYLKGLVRRDIEENGLCRRADWPDSFDQLVKDTAAVTRSKGNEQS